MLQFAELHLSKNLNVDFQSFLRNNRSISNQLSALQAGLQ